MAIIRLNALNCKGKLLNDMEKELSRRVCTVLLEAFQISKSAALIDESVLIQLLSFHFTCKAYSRNELDIDLDSLSRILHLLIRLGNVLRIWEFHCALVCPPQNPVET